MLVLLMEKFKLAECEAKEISAKTNLLAKDALHFSTAYISALNNECDYLITSDGRVYKN